MSEVFALGRLAVAGGFFFSAKNVTFPHVGEPIE